MSRVRCGYSNNEIKDAMGCLLLEQAMTVKELCKILKLSDSLVYQLLDDMMWDKKIVRSKIEGIWVYHHPHLPPDAIITSSKSTKGRHSPPSAIRNSQKYKQRKRLFGGVK